MIHPTSQPLDHALPTQFLTFQVGDEVYGVDILEVQEIKGLAPVTRMPHAPAHVVGLLNLRGRVVPVVDVRERFGLAPAVDKGPTVIVIVHAHGKVVGLVVDSVCDVLQVAASEIGPPPAVGGATGHPVKGTLCRGGSLVLLLDLARMLESDLTGPPLRPL